MTPMTIEKLSSISIGYRDDNLTQKIEIDISSWQTKYPELNTYRIEMIDGKNQKRIALNTAIENGCLVWTVTNEDTATEGEGSYQIIATGTNGEQKASRSAALVVRERIHGDGQEDAPEYMKPLLDQVAEYAAKAEASAERAESATIGDIPVATSDIAGVVKIGNGLSVTEDGTLSVDKTEDIVPQPGAPGKDGEDGKDGGYYTPTVSSDGVLSWMPSDDNMPTVSPSNIKGDKGDKGERGEVGPKGDKGDPGEAGQKGEDGKDAVVDTTLTQEGQAADAKATGDAISRLSEEIDELKENGGAGGAADAVRYTEQTLTDAQKTQARMNLWQQVPSENLFNKETVVVGEYLAPNGSVVASTNLRYAFVPLAGAGTYACAVPGSKLGFSNGNYKKIPIYDANKNYLMTAEGTSSDTASAVDNKVVFVVSDADISNGAVYMGFNVEKTMIDKAMVVKASSYPTRYIPYSPTIGIPEFGISVEKVKAFEVNPLYGKIATFTGDSICEARENNGGGYATLIGNRNAMVVENLGVSGGRITVGTEKFCITESVNSMRTDADYVILEGGVNDAAANNLGEISDNFNATLDTATFCGAFEQMVKNAIARFPGKKIGYIAVHRLKQWAPDDYNTNFPNTGYYEAAINICKKWGVPVCDLTTNCPSLYEIDGLKQAYTTNADGWHPNEEGYLKYYVPKIEAWMKTL